MAATVIPMTTVFTPPSDCLASLTYSDGYLFLGADTSCLPSGAATWGSTQSFSPAWQCPVGWTAASSSTLTIGNTITETRATCCPKVQGHISFYGDSYMLVDTDDYYYPACTAWIGGSYNEIAIINGQYYNSNSVIATNTSTYTTSVSLSTGSYNTIVAPVIQMAWQVSDRAQTSATPSTTPSTAAATPTSTTQPSSTSTPSSGGLSLAAKIAIGVVIPIVVLSIVALIIFILLRRRKAKSQSSPTREIQQEIMHVEPNNNNGIFQSAEPSINNDKYVSPNISYVPLAQGYREDNESHFRAPQTAKGGSHGSRTPDLPRYT